MVTLGTTNLTFTAANWTVPQDVTVDAIQDDIFEGPHAGTVDAASEFGAGTEIRFTLQTLEFPDPEMWAVPMQ